MHGAVVNLMGSVMCTFVSIGRTARQLCCILSDQHLVTNA